VRELAIPTVYNELEGWGRGLGSLASMLDSRCIPFHFLFLNYLVMNKNYIGIDVSSKKLNIHITGRDSANESDFEIPNTEESINDFIKDQNIWNKKYIVWAESTWRCHLICQNVFVMLGFELRILNPILTWKKISMSIRKKKTDKSDSKIIALLLSQWEWQVISIKQLDVTKRTILRTRNSIVKNKTTVKLIIQDLNKIKDNEQINQTIKTLENSILDMENTIKELESNAHSRWETDAEKLIRSIPWFALHLSAVVASEVGDFNRFPTSNQFKAYVGIDPRVVQSWDSLSNWRITKRWNPTLRHAFYLAAQVAKNYDPELWAFFDKKISEWKHYRVAMCAVVRKLCERVFAVVTKWEPYIINRLSLS
jgi:transposase